MKRFVWILVAVLSLTVSGCGMIRNLGGGTAKENAVQALVTTTRSAVLLMTAAGIAYDAGAFGEPGSERADDTWKKIAAESVRMGEALTAWSEAIKANKDASTFQSMVSQALAVIGALLPPTKRATLAPEITEGNVLEFALMLRGPYAFQPQTVAGGSR